MTKNIVKTIALENGFELKIMDVSRKISADAFAVKMKACVDIDVTPELFTRGLPPDLTFDRISRVLGKRITYAYEVERNFIMDHEKDGVFKSLVDTFLDNSGRYVGTPVFAEKFALKKYADKVG
ncbi:MAG: hypothetical protein MI862_10375 [Desulfobacterales bacterium]|nr:hypothetical protein [Desulfobacterales bacterium]